MQASILVVDDERSMAEFLRRYLRRKGHVVDVAGSAKEARQAMEHRYPDVVLMDLRLPDADGSELMAKLKADYPETRFIVVTAYGSIKSAVESTRRGAVDYLTKPFEPEELLVAIQNAMKTTLLSEEVRRLRSTQRQDGERDGRLSVYPSQVTERALSMAERAASHDGIILLLGESGAGKDYLARWIHTHSSRRDKLYFAINCAAVSRELAESELFGHEHGAFTGTRGRKRGMLELADGGTILLNEIGETPVKIAFLFGYHEPCEGGRRAQYHYRYPHHRCYESGSEPSHGRGTFSKGPLLPAQRHQDRASSLAGYTLP